MLYERFGPILSAKDPTLTGEPELLRGNWWRVWPNGTAQLVGKDPAPDGFVLVEAEDVDGALCAAALMPVHRVCQEDDGYVD